MVINFEFVTANVSWDGKDYEEIDGKKNLYAIITYIILFGIIPITLIFLLRPSMGIYIVENHNEDIHVMLNKARTTGLFFAEEYCNYMKELEISDSTFLWMISEPVIRL